MKAITIEGPSLVPVPGVGREPGNRFPEPVGTTGTSRPSLFETLAGFLDRTKNLPPLSWLIDDLVPDSGRLFVVAAPNAGKTFLALIVAKTASALGRPVFLVLEEGRPRSMYDRFRALSMPANAPIHVAHLRGVRLNDRGVRDELCAALRNHEAPVLVLDPFSSVFTGDENDTKTMNKAKTHLEELARANPRALLVLLHHTSKSGERGEGPPLYAARGSSILSGWADVQLNLTHEPSPKNSGRVAFVAHVAKGRDGERGHNMRVALSLGEGTATIEEVAGKRAQDRKEAIRKVLASADGALSKNSILDAVGGKRKSSLEVIDEMAAEGELKMDAKGRFSVARPSATNPEGNDEP